MPGVDLDGSQSRQYILPVCCNWNRQVYGVFLRKIGPHTFVRQDPDKWVRPGHRTFEYLAWREIRLESTVYARGMPGTRIHGEAAILIWRPTVLHLRLPRPLRVVYAWPSSRWDHSVATFFLGNAHSTKSWAIAEIEGVVTFNMNTGLLVTPGHILHSVPVAYTIVVAGWHAAGGTESSSVQCTLSITEEPHVCRLRNTAQILESRDPDYSEAVQMIRSITPPAEAVDFPVPSDKDLILRLSAKARLVPPSIRSMNKFWEVSLVREVWRRSEAPKITMPARYKIKITNKVKQVEVKWLDF